MCKTCFYSLVSSNRNIRLSQLPIAAPQLQEVPGAFQVLRACQTDLAFLILQQQNDLHWHEHPSAIQTGQHFATLQHYVQLLCLELLVTVIAIITLARLMPHTDTRFACCLTDIACSRES